MEGFCKLVEVKLMLVEVNGVGQPCTKGESKSYGVLLQGLRYTQMADMIKTHIAECCCAYPHFTES